MYDYNFLLKEGVIIEGHFVLRSGRHSGYYIDKSKIFGNPFWLQDVAQSIAEQFTLLLSGEVVAGPESGGAILAKAVSEEMTDIPWVGIAKVQDAQKKEDCVFYVQSDDTPAIKGKWVVIVDDVITTGESISHSIRAVENAGGEVLAVLAIIKRGVAPINFGQGIFIAVLTICELPDYDADDCPLCDRALPITPKPQTNPS